jgi:hypothetical protein
MIDQDGNSVEPSYEGMDALQLMVELSRNIQAVSVGRITLEEANLRTRRINAALEGRRTKLGAATSAQKLADDADAEPRDS